MVCRRTRIDVARTTNAWVSNNVLQLLAVLLVAYLGLCAALFAFQRSLIYMPQRGATAPGTTALVVPAEGVRVVATVRPHAGPKALIYFGGNAETVTYSLPGLVASHPDHAIYLMNYRGYGGSAGKPSEAALFADALSLFDQVAPAHSHVVTMGSSLGAAVAVYLASRRPVARLVLVTPFDSLQELAASYYPFFPVRWLLQDKFESWRYASQVTVPTLVIAAEHDEIIPRASTELLHARFRGGLARLEVVAGANHNTVASSPQYIALLKGMP